MDLKTAAKLAEMPITEFVALNPGHNRPVIKADTPVVIPAEKLETFQSNLETTRLPSHPVAGLHPQGRRPAGKGGAPFRHLPFRPEARQWPERQDQGQHRRPAASPLSGRAAPPGRGRRGAQAAQIALPEPAPRSKKFAKAGKGKAVVLARPAKGGKLAAKATGRATGKAVAKAAPAKIPCRQTGGPGELVAANHGRRT